MVAVDDASFRIHDGEFVALLGPSGCGKSTILNMVATLIAPNGGDIRVDGVAGVPGRPIRHVGYVFQKDTLFPWRTVEDNIGYALELAGVPAAAERRTRVDEAIHQAGLDGFARFYPVVAVGRHAPARVADAHPDRAAGNPADGRAVRRARHPHQARHAFGAARSLGARRARPCCS